MNVEKLMVEAYDMATASHDPSTQNGALLVWHGEVVSSGWNHVPNMRGEELQRVLNDRDLKYPRVVHAETHAIARAARAGIRTEGLAMICPWAACLTCAGIIQEAGITCLIVHGPRMRKGHPLGWTPAVDEALPWLVRSGVKVVYYEKPLPEAPRILIHGELWKP